MLAKHRPAGFDAGKNISGGAESSESWVLQFFRLRLRGAASYAIPINGVERRAAHAAAAL